MNSIRHFFKSLVLVLIIFSSTQLFAKNNKNKILSKGYTVETVKISPFENLSLSGPFNVYLTQGDKLELTIEGNESDIECIEIEQDADNLNISFNKKKGFMLLNKLNKKIDVYLTTTTLSSIDLKGSINITTQNAFHADDLKLSFKGSSHGIMSVNVENLSIDIKGSGHLFLSGYSQSQDISISGSGSYKAYKLLSGSANINVYGSGTAFLDVERELNIKVYGSGNVIYKGNPSIQSQSYGSGRVKSI